jgi:hypothetical protein
LKKGKEKKNKKKKGEKKKHLSRQSAFVNCSIEEDKLFALALSLLQTVHKRQQVVLKHNDNWAELEHVAQAKRRYPALTDHAPRQIFSLVKASDPVLLRARQNSKQLPTQRILQAHNAKVCP